MRPKKVVHAKVYIPEHKTKPFIRYTHEHGFAELISLPREAQYHYGDETLSEINKSYNKLTSVIDMLEPYKSEQQEKLLKRFVNPSAPTIHTIKESTVSEIRKQANALLKEVEDDVRNAVHEIDNLNSKQEENQNVIEGLRLLPGIKTNSYSSTDNLDFFIGIMSKESFEKAKETLGRDAVYGAEATPLGQYIVIVSVSKEKSHAVERKLHEVGFEKMEVPAADKTPSQLIVQLEYETEDMKKKQAEIKEHLTAIHHKYQDQLEVLEEQISLAREKALALNMFHRTKSITYFEAWIPAARFDLFHIALKDKVKEFYIETEERDDAPTVLENNKYIRPFELILDLYSVPKYKNLDPTIFLAIFFPLFFGFMLDDFIYGLFLAAFGIIMMRGMGKYNPGIKDFGYLLVVFSVPTILFGILFGSYFGDFFIQLGIPVPVPIDAMKEVMLVMAISIGLGIVHLLLALGTGFYENYRAGSLKKALGEQGVWIILFISIGMFVAGFNTIGLIILIASMILQVYYVNSDRGAVQAVISIFDFPGFLGNIFSYARLMALALGTAGISLAVNFMVFMAAGLPIIGIPVAIAVFIVGHLFNLLMNGLGAFIHSTRLHFLEFFTKFYEGGGRRYQPFKAQRKKTILGG